MKGQLHLRNGGNLSAPGLEKTVKNDAEEIAGQCFTKLYVGHAKEFGFYPSAQIKHYMTLKY